MVKRGTGLQAAHAASAEAAPPSFAGPVQLIADTMQGATTSFSLASWNAINAETFSRKSW
jgi:hypothetical protein